MFDTPPDPIAFTIGPLSIGWYGLGYAIGLAVAYLVLVRLARVAGEDEDVAGNGIIIVSIAALIGGRLYHVIDQWERYAADPISIVLPPYSGLGVYGGIITGTLAAWWYARRRGVPFARWADIVAPALFVMQAIGRWGNYFNQELYGPPTTLPWGIPIDCAHRLEAYACSVLPETTRFHPLFLYESISGIIGAVFLIWLGFKARRWLRPGDLLLIFFIWYGTTRFLLEGLREANWLFFEVPTAQLVSLAFIVVGVAGLIHRHRPRRQPDRPATHPERATWGALSDPDWRTRPIDEPWAHAGDLSGGSVADTSPEALGIGEPEPDHDASVADGAATDVPAAPDVPPAPGDASLDGATAGRDEADDPDAETRPVT
jgi:phosphatidylglycerol:prolipoprotein diacylglycerol transferase